MEEGLIRMVKQAQMERRLKGPNISPSETLAHLIFVDDPILFGAGSL
jgi:hypothetical protein